MSTVEFSLEESISLILNSRNEGSVSIPGFGSGVGEEGEYEEMTPDVAKRVTERLNKLFSQWHAAIGGSGEFIVTMDGTYILTDPSRLQSSYARSIIHALTADGEVEYTANSTHRSVDAPDVTVVSATMMVVRPNFSIQFTPEE